MKKLFRKQLPHQARTAKGKRLTMIKLSLLSAVAIGSIMAIPTAAETTAPKEASYRIVVSHSVDAQGNIITTITRKAGKK